jgi:mitochondrial pyruvate carrier 2
MIIKPKNVFLATVNFFLFCVGATQVSRIIVYRQSLKGTSTTDEAKDVVKEEAKVVQGAAK